MNIFNVNKVIDRLDAMIENAIEGRPIENGFDETKMSALETKLSHYLAMNNAQKSQLAQEKSRVNQLISDISHQTKTPIANILLYSQLLGENDLSKTEGECVKALSEQAEKLNFLITSLLKTSRLESGVVSLFPKESSVQLIIDDIMHQALPKAEQKGIVLKYIPTQAVAVFDPKWTMEALNNIVDNAVKYTQCDGQILITVTEYQLFCRIDVSDTGMGISEAEEAKIFSRFYRSPKVSDQDGVGIGLYLAREIISSEGGYIKVKSEIDKGSTFSMFLPMKN